MLGNYNSLIGAVEIETQKKTIDVNGLIDDILKTYVMQEAHRFLVHEGKVSRDSHEFKKTFGSEYTLG
jgi:hypothetical protein